MTGLTRNRAIVAGALLLAGGLVIFALRKPAELRLSMLRTLHTDSQGTVTALVVVSNGSSGPLRVTLSTENVRTKVVTVKQDAPKTLFTVIAAAPVRCQLDPSTEANLMVNFPRPCRLIAEGTRIYDHTALGRLKAYLASYLPWATTVASLEIPE